MSKVKICPKCHKEYDIKRKLCSNCGYVFKDVDTAIKNDKDNQYNKELLENKKAFQFERALYTIIGIISFIIELPIVLIFLIALPFIAFLEIFLAIAGEKTPTDILFIVFIFVFIKIMCLVVINQEKLDNTLKRITGIFMIITIIIEIIIFFKYSFFIN